MLKKFPSRIKYEKTHPVITIRVNEDIYERLQELRADGQSYGDVLRVGLGIQETNLKPLQERLELEQVLMEKRTVTYPCSRCGKPIEVQHDNEKEVCRLALTRAGFRHMNCP